MNIPSLLEYSIKKKKMSLSVLNRNAFPNLCISSRYVPFKQKKLEETLNKEYELLIKFYT